MIPDGDPIESDPVRGPDIPRPEGNPRPISPEDDPGPRTRPVEDEPEDAEADSLDVGPDEGFDDDAA